MLFNVVALIIGILILVGGLYYCVQAKEDKNARKIYSIFSGVGAIIVITVIVNIISV